MRVRRSISLVALTVLVAAGCGDSGGDGPPVRDVAEILDGPIVVEPAPDGRTAVVQAITRVDAACVIVFGTDPENLTGLATDDDMAGGAHQDHQPLLTGLEPDTEYFYRLQGTAIGGDLFASEVLSFRTPEAPDAGAAGNLALGASVAGVSSEFSASFAAANAVDGSPATEWSSRGDGDDAFITIDLGAATDVGSVAFRTRSMGDGSAFTETFTVTVDGGEPLGPFPAGDDPVAVAFTGQVLRFDVDVSTGGNTGAVEIEVYGP